MKKVLNITINASYAITTIYVIDNILTYLLSKLSKQDLSYLYLYTIPLAAFILQLLYLATDRNKNNIRASLFASFISASLYIYFMIALSSVFYFIFEYVGLDLSELIKNKCYINCILPLVVTLPTTLYLSLLGVIGLNKNKNFIRYYRMLLDILCFSVAIYFIQHKISFIAALFKGI